jgi:PEGA domain-containing protein
VVQATPASRATSGAANFTAMPWAEVWMNGKKLGETPLMNHRVPLGKQEFVFKHPRLGERRVTVTIRADSVASVSVDMNLPSSRPEALQGHQDTDAPGVSTPATSHRSDWKGIRPQEDSQHFTTRPGSVGWSTGARPELGLHPPTVPPVITVLRGRMLRRAA